MFPLPPLPFQDACEEIACLGMTQFISKETPGSSYHCVAAVVLPIAEVRSFFIPEEDRYSLIGDMRGELHLIVKFISRGRIY